MPTFPTEMTTGLLGLLAAVACFAAVTLWSIWHAMHRHFPSVNEKVFWIQLAVLVPFLGGIAYAIWGRKRGLKQ